MARPTFTTRLAWNENNWRSPSGAAREIGTFVAENGFGHEEWLNRAEWNFDGYRYSFLQGVSSSRVKWEGQRLHLRLFAIAPDKQRWYVGEITDAEVLTPDQAAAARSFARKDGWLDHMKAEVAAVNGRVSLLSNPPLDLFNIRFKPRALRMFATLVPVGAGDQVRRYSRYGLVENHTVAAREWERRTRRAPLQGDPSTLLQTRRIPHRQITIDSVERKMQSQLATILRRRYPGALVERERDFIDLKMKTRDQLVLFELKKHQDARQAIRAALGQLLDYALFPPANNGHITRLVIVGQGAATDQSEQYLQRLAAGFGVPLCYRQFVLGSERFSL